MSPFQKDKRNNYRLVVLLYQPLSKHKNTKSPPIYARHIKVIPHGQIQGSITGPFLIIHRSLFDQIKIVCRSLSDHSANEKDQDQATTTPKMKQEKALVSNGFMKPGRHLALSKRWLLCALNFPYHALNFPQHSQLTYQKRAPASYAQPSTNAKRQQ